MLSIHGYVGAEPELGKPDTGGQVVFVLELAKRFARLGYQVDLVTRRFGKQAEIDRINPNLRVWRIPFGGRDFLRKEDMHDHLRRFRDQFPGRSEPPQAPVRRGQQPLLGCRLGRPADRRGTAHPARPHAALPRLLEAQGHEGARAATRRKSTASRSGSTRNSSFTGTATTSSPPLSSRWTSFMTTTASRATT